MEQSNQGEWVIFSSLFEVAVCNKPVIFWLVALWQLWLLRLRWGISIQFEKLLVFILKIIWLLAKTFLKWQKKHLTRLVVKVGVKKPSLWPGWVLSLYFLHILQ